MAIQQDDTHFILKHKDGNVGSDGKEHQEIKLELKEEDGKIEFKGIPDIMKKNLISFAQDEIKQHPTTVLNVIIKQTYTPK